MRSFTSSANFSAHTWKLSCSFTVVPSFITVASVFEVASLLSAAEESAAAAVVSAAAAVVSVELLEEPQPAMERTIAPAITADNNFALFFIMTS